jgi:hypothetical protein
MVNDPTEKSLSMAGALKSDLQSLFSAAVLRANPQYELVLFDRLPPAQQQMFADLRQQPNFYGLLRPVAGSGLSVKSVSRDTALLYLTLRDPGTLPHYAQPANADQVAGMVRLVLDQILQLQHDDRFVSGADAHAMFYEPLRDTVTETRIERLSLAALQYGQALAVTDVMELSARLYNYHRIPLSDRWLTALGTPQRITERLGIAPNGRHQRLLDQSWKTVSGGLDADGGDADRDSASGWLSWVLRRPVGTAPARSGMHKLYISPLPDFVENTFAITLQTLASTPVVQLKIGADVEGWLRPDKMVAYFQNFDDLRAAADVLAARLDGCPAHGVPFTAQLAGDGLLSWGVDPPASERLLNWQPEESWRLWLTNRLANALLTARGAGGSRSLPPWQYALERLELEGIDTRSWTAARRTWTQ